MKRKCIKDKGSAYHSRYNSNSVKQMGTFKGKKTSLDDNKLAKSGKTQKKNAHRGLNLIEGYTQTRT